MIWNRRKTTLMRNSWQTEMRSADRITQIIKINNQPMILEVRLFMNHETAIHAERVMNLFQRDSIHVNFISAAGSKAFLWLIESRWLWPGGGMFWNAYCLIIGIATNFQLLKWVTTLCPALTHLYICFPPYHKILTVTTMFKSLLVEILAAGGQWMV